MQEITELLDKFQRKVHSAAGNHHLQFTAEIRTDEKNPPPPTKQDKVQTQNLDEFPFLDMKMSWSPIGDLRFGVFRKKQQQSKYAVKDSTYTLVMLSTIPPDVLNRLAKITPKHPKPNLNG